MTDARKRNPFFSWISSLSLMQEVLVLAGVVLFIAALVIHGWLWRSALLVLSGISIAYLLVLYWKSTAFASRESGNNLEPGEKNENQIQKRNFDDFRSFSPEKTVNVTDEPIKKDQIQVHQSEPDTMAEYTTPKLKTFDWDLKEFIDASETLQAMHNGPRSEFNTLTKRILTVIKEVNFAHTVALFWVNREKHQLVIENFVTDSVLFTTHRRLELGTDFISQIAQSGKPQIVNYLNSLSQNELLPYYTGPETVQTFLGIPIFYPGSATETQLPVAVLAVDCREGDAYGNETISLMAQFTKMISTLLVSYTSKYDLLLDSEVLRSIDRFRDQLVQDFSVPIIARSLAEEASRLVPWDYIVVVLFDDNRKVWVAQHILNRMNDPYVSVLSEVDMQQSLVGTVIQSSTPKIIEHIESLHQPRFYQAERCDSRGSIAVIPLNSFTRCYGALLIESKDSRTYSETDVKLVQRITLATSWALEILSLTEVTNNFVSLDETTGVATHKAFMERLHEEVHRANDFNTELSVVMISIDRMDDQLTRHGKEAFDFVLHNVGRIIKTSIRPYDTVGRFDFNCFAVILANTTPNEASLWAEKIRKNVASNIVNIDNKSFSVTISIGVAGVSTEASDVELLENANLVMRKAVEAGGNIVRVY